MCVVSVFNQRAASCRFDVDGELIKQYLWCLHQLQHFVLPLLVPSRQTAAPPALELKYSCAVTSVSSRGQLQFVPGQLGLFFQDSRL